MKLIKTKFEDTYIIKNQKIKDERGFFMRGFCESVFLKTGVKFKIKQTNFSYNKKKTYSKRFSFSKKTFFRK